MTEEDSFGTTFNKNLTSSLKYYNFDGMTKKQIIEKYENLLFEREKQIGIISMQMGNVHQKLMNINDELEELQNKKYEKDENVLQKQIELNQVLREKDHIFNKLTNLMEENDKFRKIITSNSTNLSLLNSIDDKDKSYDRKKRGKSLTDKRNRRISTKTMDEYNKKLSSNNIKKMNSLKIKSEIGVIKSPTPVNHFNITFTPSPKKENGRLALNLTNVDKDIPVINSKNSNIPLNLINKNNNIVDKNNSGNEKNNVDDNNNNNNNNVIDNNEEDKKNTDNENNNEKNNDLENKKEEEVKTTPIVKLPKRHHKKKDKKKSSKKLASDDLDYEPVFK